MKRFALILSAVSLLAFACGGRNLEAGPGPDDDDDGSGQGGAGGMSASGGMGGLGGEGGEGAGGEGEGGEGGDDPTPIDCFQCAAQNCPQALQCFTNPDCIQGLVCAVSDCLGGGAPDFMCLTECFDGDFEAAQQALTSIICITSSCGEECGDLLPFPGGP